MRPTMVFVSLWMLLTSLSCGPVANPVAHLQIVGTAVSLKFDEMRKAESSGPTAV